MNTTETKTIAATVKPIQKVLSQKINDVTDRLWSIVWDLLEGQPSWHYPDTDYEFYPDWCVYEKTFELRSIKGRLDGKRFKINFAVISNLVELESEELNATFGFSSNPRYGHFSVPDSMYLKSGSAYYEITSEPVEFLGSSKKRLMTFDKEDEAVNFISKLCDRIEQRTAANQKK